MAIIIVSILSVCLALLYAGIVLYLRQGWMRLPAVAIYDVRPRTKVSVLIAARNEEAHIGATISDILAQNFPSELLEVIVVDDHSIDRTSEIVLSYEARGVRLIRLNEDKALNSYKKKAISEAISRASGELIVTTDADCRMNSDWLKTVVLFYEKNGLKLVSSPVAYFRERAFFQEVQTLEFLYLIGLGASSIGHRMPTTCNGANLAYRKDVFLELGGFKGIDDLASGDDELFLQKVAERYPESVGFCKSPAAVVYTYAKENLSQFIEQRKRWASKSTRYKNKKFVALGVSIWLFNVLFLSGIAVAFIHPQYWWLVGLSFLLKFLPELFFLMPLCSFINRRQLIWYLPILTVIHPVYMVYIGIAGNSGKYNWKGRMVR